MFDTEKFIREVENRPALYNLKLKEYSNRDAKMKLWEEIAVRMYDNWSELPIERKNMLSKELQTKWKSLRDQFKKAVRTEIDRNVKKKKYLYYDHLQFLLRHSESREISSNLRSTQEVDDDDEEECGSEDTRLIEPLEEKEPQLLNIEPLPSTSHSLRGPNSFATTSTERREKRKLKKGRDDGMQTITEILQQSVDLQREKMEADRTGNRAFLLSVLPFLDRMSDEIVVEARIGIMQVIQRCITLQNQQNNVEVVKLEQTQPPSPTFYPQ